MNEPLRVVIKIALAVFVGEMVIMLALTLPGDPLEVVSHAFVDAGALMLITGPVAYYWVIRPYVRQRDEAEQAHRAAQLAADEANRAKSEFLANMSHELRTPLNAVLGFSDILRRQTFGPVGSPKYMDYANDIHASGKHLLELIDDILDVAKIESDKAEMEEEAIDVPGLVESALAMVRTRAHEGEVRLEVDLSDGLPPLLADRRKLKQILLNLLSNAVKFSPPGGEVALKVWSREDSGYVFQVADNGIGMALEDIPKALAPFGQVESALTRRYEGTGLGLPLAKSLVEMHSGSLDLQSQLGAGTTVTVRFPAERVVQGEAEALRKTG